MNSTKLELDEKEALIKFLCTQGQIKIKNNKKVFEFFRDIDLEDEWSAAPLLEKAFVKKKAGKKTRIVKLNMKLTLILIQIH